MYPTWLTNLFINNTCPECRGAVTLDDIIAIGARRPEPFEAHLREALAMILVSCRHCGQRINFATRCAKDGLIDAISAFSAIIEASAPVGPSAFGQQTSESTGQTGDNNESALIRPSVRQGQSSTAPTDSEIKLFLSRLKRMSFKPGSRSFKKFTGPDQRKVSDDNAEDHPLE